MEKKLNELVGSDYFFKDPLENLLMRIGVSCAELIKYGPLFNDGDLRKYYENRVRDIRELLIMQCRYFLGDYYREKIDNVCSKVEEFLSEAVEKTVETVKTVKTTVETMETVETVDETDKES